MATARPCQTRLKTSSTHSSIRLKVTTTTKEVWNLFQATEETLLNTITTTKWTWQKKHLKPFISYQIVIYNM